jgi:hypothetical protein
MYVWKDESLYQPPFQLNKNLKAPTNSNLPN